MSDTVKSWIEERRNIKESAHLSEVGAALAHEDGLDMFPRALDALQAVLELHKPMPDGNCVSCTWFSDGNIVPHPCPTVQAIEGAIND